ncbi:MAG: hypothetical protein LBG97_08250 [Coriobacteriales bacterium]|nr:hypothetical protein [Coriobacteriales bacterium]
MLTPKKFLRLALAITVAVSFSLVAGGCWIIDEIIGEPIKPTPTSIVFVTGVHQGSVYPDFSNLLDVNDEENEVLLGGLQSSKPESIKMFNAAYGETASYTEYTFDLSSINWGSEKTTVEHDFKNYIDEKLPQEINEKVKPTNDHANSSDAGESNHADYLEAILQAALIVKNAVNDAADDATDDATDDAADDAAANKIIYVSGSGLSDSGLLDFAHGGYLDDASLTEETFIEKLEELAKTESGVDISSAFAREPLKGCKIIWNDLGATSAPQLGLTEEQKGLLKNTYTWIFKRYGAEDDNIKINNSGSHSETAIDTIIDTIWTVDPVPVGKIIVNISYTEESALGFIPNCPEFDGDTRCFLDEEKADVELRRLAGLAKRNLDKTITITGYIAKIRDHEWMSKNPLSRRRAETVESRLRDLGVTNIIEIDDKGNSESKEADDGNGRQEDRKIEIVF